MSSRESRFNYIVEDELGELVFMTRALLVCPVARPIRSVKSSRRFRVAERERERESLVVANEEATDDLATKQHFSPHPFRRRTQSGVLDTDLYYVYIYIYAVRRQGNGGG